ncbi:MAG: SlyX family protein [Bdellovibrionaceae bacterium]|mgnify:CR=1 FL=1|jgi:SlyX protein|nr:SlyX family protein [Pseudobdellovibrionaceae bacterium]
MDSRLLHIETQLAYQEDTIEQLNQVIIDQQRYIDELTVKVDAVVDYVKSSSEANIVDTSQEVPPPHY